MNVKTFHWLDTERIGEELADAHPGVDPLTIAFTDMRDMVKELPAFEERDGHPCSEKVLEAILLAWIEEAD